VVVVTGRPAVRDCIGAEASVDIDETGAADDRDCIEPGARLVANDEAGVAADCIGAGARLVANDGVVGAKLIVGCADGVPPPTRVPYDEAAPPGDTGGVRGAVGGCQILPPMRADCPSPA
jgi:hypothetical protein